MCITYVVVPRGAGNERYGWALHPMGCDTDPPAYPAEEHAHRVRDTEDVTPSGKRKN